MQSYPDKWAPLDSKTFSSSSIEGTFSCQSQNVKGEIDRVHNLGSEMFWDEVGNCDQLTFRSVNKNSFKVLAMKADKVFLEKELILEENYYLNDDSMQLRSRIEGANANIAYVWALNDVYLYLDEAHDLIIKHKDYYFALAMVVVPIFYMEKEWYKYKRITVKGE